MSGVLGKKTNTYKTLTMNKVLLVDASSSDCRIMAGLLTKAGNEPITAEDFDVAKDAVENLPPGAVIVTAMKFAHGTAQELINWQKHEGYNFPVIALVDNLNPLEIADVMKNGGAVDIIQRGAIDKQLVETVRRYVKAENIVLQLGKSLIPRRSKAFREIEQSIERLAATNANCIIFGESGMGKEQIARQIYLQSSRTQKPLVVLEAGGAALIGKHRGVFPRGTGRYDDNKEHSVALFRETISVTVHSGAGTPRSAYHQHCQLLFIEDGS